MAATFLQALVERYGTMIPVGPELWRGIQPEGSAQNLDSGGNVVLLDLGQTPTYEQDDGDTLSIAYVTGRARFVAYAGGLAAAEALAVAIQNTMESHALAVGADEDVRLVREDYRANPVQRGPNAQFVFAAATTYRAMFNPTAGGG